MARVGLLGRIMLLLLGALTLLVLATVALDTWQRRQERSPYGTRFPRVDQAANIVTLLKDADPALRPAILRAFSGEALRTEIMDTAPDDAGLIREPRLERRLRRMTGDLDGPLRAYTDTSMLHRGLDPEDVNDRDRNLPIGHLATATYRLPDGLNLVIAAVEKHRSLMPWLLGLYVGWYRIREAGDGASARRRPLRSRPDAEADRELRPCGKTRRKGTVLGYVV